ncbi:MAG TPA: hypothetical protein VGP79_02165, partial [Bryobacteraceae bacterium]|nr:hypothetical protein [Bryobacteraceae bacterium]
RLDVALSLLTGVGEIAVFVRLATLQAVLRYWYFSLYLLCGAMQCIVWILGTPTSFAYAVFWLCTTPLMIGLRIAVVAELWNQLSLKRGADPRARRFAVIALGIAVAVSLATGVDLWLVGWRPTTYRMVSLAIRYSASILAIFCALVTWFGYSARNNVPENTIRHAFLLTSYLGSIAAGHLWSHLVGGSNETTGMVMNVMAAITFGLWVLLFTKEGERLETPG